MSPAATGIAGETAILERRVVEAGAPEDKGAVLKVTDPPIIVNEPYLNCSKIYVWRQQKKWQSDPAPCMPEELKTGTISRAQR